MPKAVILQGYAGQGSNRHTKGERTEDGDQSTFILNQIKEEYENLYARTSGESDSVNEGKQVKYGFHTNTSTKPQRLALDGIADAKLQNFFDRTLQLMKNGFKTPKAPCRSYLLIRLKPF